MKQLYPTFSIVTPSFNQGEFIELTINSVLSQEGDFFIEYNIVDGGSNDNSIDIIKKYDLLLQSKQYPVKCRGIKFLWSSTKDSGQYDAINKGFTRSSGDYMAWINSDDMYFPCAFKTISLIFQKFPEVEWITANATRINQDGSVIGIDNLSLYPRALIRKGVFNGHDGPFIQQESTFWRRNLWNKLEQKLNTNYNYAADFELWTRFAEKAELVKVNTQFGAFRKHNTQKTSTIAEYDQEVASMRRVSTILKLYCKMIKLLKRIYFLDRFFLLLHNTEEVYYSVKEREWIKRRVRGRKS